MTIPARTAIMLLVAFTAVAAAGCGATGTPKVIARGSAGTNATAPPSTAPASTAPPMPPTTTPSGGRSSRPACDALTCGRPPEPVSCPAHPVGPSFNGTYCGPDPIAGNGLGPSGVCTGRETTPPCGAGMVAGRYYPYTLPGSCDGRLVLDGRHWISELPPPTPIPAMYVWVSIGADRRHAGFISPNGAVGFDIEHGQAVPACSPPPNIAPTGLLSPARPATPAP